MKPLDQHQIEIQQNKETRAGKPLIRKIYSGFYDQIVAQLNRDIAGKILEIGSGSGELKSRVPESISSDLFPNPWLDLVCDAYRLPFSNGSVSNLVLLDVFHHLVRPAAFLSEAARVLPEGGRVILFEPFVSWTSRLVYGCFHHEPISWRNPIDTAPEPPQEQSYYAAQGNATRLFFGSTRWLPSDLKLVVAKAQADFAYLLSGGLSKPALYPEAAYSALSGMDRFLSRLPGLFAARCLVVIEKQ